MESVTCLRCRSATPPVLIDQDRRIAPPSLLYGPTPSGPGLCGMKRAGAIRGPGPSSYPESLSCRQGGFPETPDSPGPRGLPLLDRGTAASLCIGRGEWLCYMGCGAGIQ
jgi:hypothetical protein